MSRHDLSVTLTADQWRQVFSYLELATVDNRVVLDRLHTQLGRLVEHPCQMKQESDR